MSVTDGRHARRKEIKPEHRIEMCENAGLPGAGSGTMICIRGARYGFFAWMEAKSKGMGPPLSVPLNVRTPAQAMKSARASLRRVQRMSRPRKARR